MIFIVLIIPAINAVAGISAIDARGIAFAI
jgi:hypothetical protein